MRISLVVALVAGVGCGLVGCGSSGGNGGGSLSCEWLAGENCWKTTATQATSCLPPSSQSGTFSADNRSCTYASGTVVTFSQPLVLPLPDDQVWNFTITTGGQTCLQYKDSANGFTLTVGNDSVTQSTTGVTGLKVTCPGGETYSNANALDLLSCGADGGLSLDGFPGTASAWTDTSVSLSLIGTSTEPASSGLELFNCRK